MDLAAIIGAVSGVISIIGVVYLLGVWKGSVDSKLKDIVQRLSQYPPEETALMTKTLWDIYVVDALRGRPDLAEHGSAYKLSKVAEDLIPDHLKAELCQISKNIKNCNKSEAIASGWLVVKYLGMEAISQMAEERGLSVQESIAILSCYLVNNKGV
ncbi:MAG: hypothetical protein JRE40_08210 [Deltaproteobacteria bacterium]|nr:hypothetical protein [Deltaproteobacteria bacterium]